RFARQVCTCRQVSLIKLHSPHYRPASLVMSSVILLSLWNSKELIAYCISLLFRRSF
ncbi:unnamed protein product, partial [Allacma fusca]